MKIVCISAANIEVARGNSASVRTCQLVGELFRALRPDAQIEVVPLLDYEMRSCIMCGGCVTTQRCVHDEAFNRVLEKMAAADAIFLVVPHYAPIPSKVMIMTEKMEEMCFLGWTADEKHYRAPLAEKPLGIIGHGGQNTTPEVLQ
jgi:multimeric flavodoxin WrbA